MGDRMVHLQGALDHLLDAGITIASVSAVYQTAPVGGPEQDDFLNAVVLIDTDLEPHALLSVCQQIEAAHERVREVRWGPRTLDVDIIHVDGVRLDDPDLTLPHPRAHERAFVCIPWLEVDPAASLGDLSLPCGVDESTGVARREDLALVIGSRSR
jgi:2-amino-4-hydroxy-6-hydroxymethyldihydropteridine diphosphokinase